MDENEQIQKLASRYIWWKTPEESMMFPQQVFASVMNLGTLEDLQELESLVGEASLRKTLAAAEAGQFRPRSWTYWHARLNGLFDTEVPPPPVRRFG